MSMAPLRQARPGPQREGMEGKMQVALAAISALPHCPHSPHPRSKKAEMLQTHREETEEAVCSVCWWHEGPKLAAASHCKCLTSYRRRRSAWTRPLSQTLRWFLIITQKATVSSSCRVLGSRGESWGKFSRLLCMR